MAADRTDGPPPGGPMLTRRAALKTGAVGAASIATLGAAQSGAQVGPVDLGDVAPVGEADAIAPYVIAGLGLAATGWTLRDIAIDTFGDDPPDGLGPDTLHKQVWQQAKQREAYNENSIGQAENLVSSMEDNAYAAGKRAGLDLLYTYTEDSDGTQKTIVNENVTESELIEEAQSAADEQFATVEENIAEAWNAAVDHYLTLFSSVESHDDLSTEDVFGFNNLSGSYADNPSMTGDVGDVQYTLLDGREITLKLPSNDNDYITYWLDEPQWFTDEGYSLDEDRFDHSLGDVTSDLQVTVSSPGDGDSAVQINTVKSDDPKKGGFKGAFYRTQLAQREISDNLATWCEAVYEEAQDGDVEPDDLLTGRDLAENIAADDGEARAIADLVASNIPIDLDRETTIELLDDEITMQGFLAVTDNTNVSELEAGDTIDPNETDEDDEDLYGTWYFAYRPGTYIQPWDEYDDDYGIQGGEIRFTADPTETSDGLPVENAEYVVETNQGETHRLAPDDFSETEIDGTTYWTADVGGDIAEINRVRRVFEGDEDDADDYQTMILDQPFEIVEIEGGDSVDVQQPREPQDVDNYTTQEEWDTIRDDQEELIDEFEEASGGGGGLPGVGSLPALPDWIPGSGLMQWGVAAGGAIVGVNLVSNLLSN